MIVSTSNIAKNANIKVTPESDFQDIAVVTDGDYSSVFVETLPGEMKIEFDFDEPTDIGYLAIGGSNISRKDSISISTSTSGEVLLWSTASGENIYSSDGFALTVGFGEAVDDGALGLDESVTLMYKVDRAGVRRVSITIAGTGKISISEIAMGEFYEIPRGEQAGFPRPWTVPNMQTRGASNISSAPINLAYEARPLTSKITVPNNVMADFDSGWYKFIKFASKNTFYVLEDQNRFHSYAGFNSVPAMTTAHSQTRSLGVSSISFRAFAKSTEALF